jgi:7-cyano-7-deazaguanine synthase
MATPRVVTLLSGGIDSMVLCDMLRKEGKMRQVALFVDYGQRAAEKEYRAAQAYARGRVRLETASVKLGGLALRSQLITGKVNDKAFLAGRNLLLLFVASLKACELKTGLIAIGLRDVAQFPDTSDIFVRGFSNISYMAFGRPLTVLTPLLHMEKAEVIRMGRSLGTNLSLSYSCYLGKSESCGRCLGCRDRKGLIK